MKKINLLLLSVLLLACALRLYRASEQLMWGDEAFSVFSAQRSLAAITLEGAENDPHPPLYYYLLHFYLLCAGASELALRFFSAFFGVATVALVYAIGARLYNRRVGALAMLIAALAPFHVYYSQEIRMYALAMFLTAGGVYAFIQWRDAWRVARDASGHHPSPVSRHPSGFYTLTLLLALYTSYHTAFVLLALGISLLPQLKIQRGFFARWLAVSIGAVILFLPWLVFRFSSTLEHLGDRAAGATPFDLPYFVARGFAALTVGTTIPPNHALWLAAIFAALIVVALTRAVKASAASWREGLLLALVVVPMLAVYAPYLTLPIFTARAFALALVPLAILLARALTLLPARAGTLGLMLLAAVSAYALGDYYFRFSRYNPQAEDYLPIIRAVEADAREGDSVLFHAFWHAGYFQSHYRGARVEYRDLSSARDLRAALAQSRQVWAVVQNFSDHPGETFLAQNAFFVGEQKFGALRVLAYRAGSPGNAEKFASPIVLSNGVALTGYAITDTPVESGGGLVAAQLDWWATREIASDYVVSVRLTDARGEVIWAQRDVQPGNGTLPTSRWNANGSVQDRHALAVPPGTPPGEYTARVVMYDANSGRAASVIAPENWRGQAITLGTITVQAPTLPRAVIPPTGLGTRWNEIALAGMDAAPEAILPGDTLALTLYWRALTAPPRDYRAAIQVLDASGATRAATLYLPPNGAYPPRAWRAGEIWLDKERLVVDATAAPGEAVVVLTVVDANGIIAPDGNARTRAVRVENHVGLGVEIARVKIASRARRFDLPTPRREVNANLENKIRLRGYDFNAADFRAGALVPLTLYWQARAPLTERHTVFVHILDAAGALVAQSDGEPQNGAAPTTSWLVGEVIADRYEIALPEKLSAGEYRVVVGMYLPATGARMLWDAGADTLGLESVMLR